MLTLPALKLQQFSQEFFLVNLAAADVDRLVRFEVLGPWGVKQGGRNARKPAAPGRVNWAALEKEVRASDAAYQRPIIRKKIDELTQYYLSCREHGLLPAIPGAVILTSERVPEFAAAGGNPFLGLLQLAEEEGSLRVLDGQHRLLALAALLHDPAIADDDRQAARRLQVPAILFAGLPPDHIVELFVTINAKHTRLNQSHLVSLEGRKLYGDADLARVHDVLRKLNDGASSPLRGEIKMLGVGSGRVPQAGLAQEMKQVLETLGARGDGLADRFRVEMVDFYLAYFKEVTSVFEDAWNGRKYSIRSASALRAFIRVVPDVLDRALASGRDARAEALRLVLAPWRERIGSARFETAGAWRARVGGGGKETVRLLARDLGAALGDAAGGAS